MEQSQLPQVRSSSITDMINDLPKSRGSLVQSPQSKKSLARTKAVLLNTDYASLVATAQYELSNLEDPWVSAKTRNPNYNAEKGKGYVYLVHAEGTPFYKIGTTKDLKARLSNLSTGSFTPLTACACSHVEDAYEVESELHEKYEYYWERGEWFVFPKFLLRQVENTFAYLHETGGKIDDKFYDL